MSEWNSPILSREDLLRKEALHYAMVGQGYEVETSYVVERATAFYSFLSAPSDGKAASRPDVL